MARGRNFSLAIILKAVDKATAPFRRVAKVLRGPLADGARAAFAKVRRLNNALRTSALARGVGRSLRRMRTVMLGVAGAAAAAAAAVFGLWRSVTGRGDQVAKAARALGLTAEAFQELQFAADRSGVSQENFNVGLRGFVTRLGQLKSKTGELFSVLKKAGPQTRALLEGAKTTEEAILVILRQIAATEDPARRVELATAAFGRSGAAFINLALEGKAGIAALREEARELGILTNAQAEDAEAAVDAWTNFKRMLQGVANVIGSAVNPKLTALFDSLTKAGKDGRPMIEGLAKSIADLIPTADQVAVVAREIGAAFKWARDNLGPLVDMVGGPAKAVLIALAVVVLAPLVAAFAGLAAVIAPIVGSIGLVGAAFVAAFAVIAANWSKIGEWFEAKFERVREAFRSGFLEGVVAILREFNIVTIMAEAIDGLFAWALGIDLSEIGRRIARSIGRGFVGLFDGILPDFITGGGAAAPVAIPAFGGRGAAPPGAFRRAPAEVRIRVEDDRIRAFLAQEGDGIETDLEVGPSQAGGFAP